ncbi:hypothetical protein HXX76_012107 [Chlamydomonas incerta]|uniref:Uncharacterized protein n=1 Tax=Chlamydomonas incerta TaxID=51695 RepID=A0A835VSM9_CHLIN|nr:hypothetical protein HXX76_012107 [Chlamydomonas incerta]|eukprot:KAG2427782.1 hypothetical protein HXX76_012107 [Chlamydomonas incerta]
MSAPSTDAALVNSPAAAPMLPPPAPASSPAPEQPPPQPEGFTVAAPQRASPCFPSSLQADQCAERRSNIDSSSDSGSPRCSRSPCSTCHSSDGSGSEAEELAALEAVLQLASPSGHDADADAAEEGHHGAMTVRGGGSASSREGGQHRPPPPPVMGGARRAAGAEVAEMPPCYFVPGYGPHQSVPANHRAPPTAAATARVMAAPPPRPSVNTTRPPAVNSRPAANSTRPAVNSTRPAANGMHPSVINITRDGAAVGSGRAIITVNHGATGRFPTQGLCAGMPDDRRRRILESLEREPPPDEGMMCCVPGCSPSEIRARHLITHGLDTCFLLGDLACTQPHTRLSMMLVVLPYRASIYAVLLRREPPAAGWQPQQMPPVGRCTAAVDLFCSRAPQHATEPYLFLLSYRPQLSPQHYLDCVISNDS